MSCNGSSSQPSAFTLAGIPGLESAHTWFAIPFLMVYIFTVLGNCTVLFLIWADQSLHEPMFLLLALLAAIDLSLVTSVVPRMLAIFWAGAKEVSVHACLAQMFFIPSFYVMESGVLLAMAFDRFVAILQPLRYTTIMARHTLVKMGLVIVVRTVVVLAPAPVMANKLVGFRTHIIAYSYCAYMAMVQIACGDTSNHVAYGLMVIVASVGVDLLFIGLSYGFILQAVFHIPSKEAKIKALSTCGSHLCLILTFYSPVVFSVLAQTLGYSMAPHIRVIVDNLYFLVPPMVNPLIYGVRTKQMRERVLWFLRCPGT
ncbi:olfactory receptor 52K2-like [Tachyglossus aculeatus]|uniref:olfactory receptor 52K2-like n=1 Tax=Tachyglossus aculeatus TaxID=9261 RepID=UPI0018F55FAB|nr:olfactory receptor 52K2-like [Tachyglossus aculeatus]